MYVLSSLVGVVLLGQVQSLDNLSFQKASLKGWEGKGFYLTTADARGPSNKFAACSSDAGCPERVGMTRYAFVMPADAHKLTTRAFASYPLGSEPGDLLDIVLTGPDNKPRRKLAKSMTGSWQPATGLELRRKNEPVEYVWEVSDLQGKIVQVVLVDRDPKPGSFVYCAGFKVESLSQLPTGEQVEHFGHEMLALQSKFNLAPMTRFESKRFVGIGNAGDQFSSQRLRYVEIFYDLFVHHFQQRGFSLKNPNQKLMLAIFDSQEGFEAYLGRKMPGGVTGIYHQGSNRLAIYDVAQNRSIEASKSKALDKAIFQKNKTRFVENVEREYTDLTKEINVSTVMHEGAHQLSFNMGILNRQGDVPAWLAEGLACYCEAAENGDWQAIGAANPGRIKNLAAGLKSRQLMTVERMVRGDDWLNSPQIVLGYAQSWALYRMLMQERTTLLRQYLALIYQRQAPEHRLTDFAQVFGDMNALERRYQKYVEDLVTQGR